MSQAVVSFMLALSFWILTVSCKPPPVENVYRKESRFPDGIKASVALLTGEWAGKVRFIGSAWLIEGSRGGLFTAKHVIDSFFGKQISLGGRECKIFLNSRVYDCVVDRIAPLRDAAVLRIADQFNAAELPRPYRIASEQIKVGDEVFVMGFHLHPQEITEANEKEGFRDTIVPIFRTFYEQRFGNQCGVSEIVFDVLKAKVVRINERVIVDKEQMDDPLGKLKHLVNMYFRVVTERNHKFSFGGLSGGVAVRLNENGEPEAVGIITAEKPVELEYDEEGNLISPCGVSPMVADTLVATPIESVADLVVYAKQMR